MGNIDRQAIIQLATAYEAARSHGENSQRLSFQGRKVTLQEATMILEQMIASQQQCSASEAQQLLSNMLDAREAKSLSDRLVTVLKLDRETATAEEEKTTQEVSLNSHKQHRIRYGGKGVFLFQMRQAGLPVPPFKSIALDLLQQLKNVQLSTDQVKSFIAGLDTEKPTISLEELVDYVSGFQAFYEKEKRDSGLMGIAKLMTSDFFYDQIKNTSAAQAINQLYDELMKESPNQAVIVRSSGINEDNYGDAQAGKFDSHVQGSEPIVKTCLKVMASAYKAEVCPQGQPQPLSLVMQTCVNSRFGGVLFSRSTLQDDAVKVEYTPGQARGVVAGNEGVTAHSYSIKRSEEPQCATWKKGNISIRYKLQPSDDGQGFTERKIKHTQGADDQLPEAVLSQLQAHADQLEQQLCCPVDVEFAVGQKGELYILQVRPVTTLAGGSHYCGDIPTATLASGQLVSEGCCSAQVISVNKKVSAKEIPTGAIIYADHASDWMLTPEFLKRAGGFVLKNVGMNDHVAITLRQAGKPCLMTNTPFDPPPPPKLATLIAGQFNGAAGAVLIGGDKSQEWLNKQTTIIADYSDFIKNKKPSKSSLACFHLPQDGFAWLSQQNEKLLNYFDTKSLLHRCLSPEYSRLLSMSAQRLDVADLLMTEVNNLLLDSKAYIQGYKTISGLGRE